MLATLRSATVRPCPSSTIDGLLWLRVADLRSGSTGTGTGTTTASTTSTGSHGATAGGSRLDTDIATTGSDHHRAAAVRLLLIALYCWALLALML